jgi:hypothetical protein
LIWQFLSENFESNLEVIEFFDISKHDTEWENEHWDKTEEFVEGVNSAVVSPPNDDVSIEENPNNAHYKSERVVIVIPFTQRRWDR